MNMISASELGLKAGKGIKRKSWSDFLTVQGAEPGKPTFLPAWMFPDRLDPKITPEDFAAHDWIVEGYTDEENKEAVQTYWFVVCDWTKPGGHGTSSRVLTLTGDGEFHPGLAAQFILKNEGWKEVCITNWKQLTVAQYEIETKVEAKLEQPEATEVPAAP